MAKPMTAVQVLAAMKLWGVPYKQWPGWTTRGRDPEHGPFSDVHGLVIHHTGSDIGQSDDYLDFLATRGRPGLPGPLCNAATDMDGDLWLIAQGRANHAGSGSSATLNHVVNEDYPGFAVELKPGPDSIDGNAVYYGNEVRYDGGQPMTAKQYAAVTRWAAAICHFHGWSALSIIGHREHTGRKPDPGSCPMNKFRTDVAALLKAGPPKATQPPAATPTTPSVPEDDMPSNDEVRAIVADELNKQDRDLWAAPTGTGTHFIANTKAGFAALTAQIAGLTAAVQTLAQNNGYDPEAVIAAVKEATEKAAGEALADLKITLTVDDEPATPEA